MEFKKLSKKGYLSILRSTANINFWIGAVRSTKTINSIVRLCELAQSDRVPKDVSGVLVGKTIGTLEKNVLLTIASFVGKNNFIYKRSKQECFIYGRRFDVVGAKDESSKDRIQGMTYGIGYCDELVLYPRSFWDMLQTRFISIANYIILATMNPDNPYHWLKTDFIDKYKELGIKIFHFILDDNPHIPEKNREKLKQKFKGVFFKRFILGLWVLAEGLVYACFDEKKHIFSNKNFQPHQKYNIGVDYGTQNPCTFGLWGIENKKNYLVKEYYYCGRDENKLKTNEDYVNDLVDFVGNRLIEGIYIDPSAISFITTIKKMYPKLGYFIKSDIDNSVNDGIQTVSSKLGADEVLIHKDCKNHIREFNSYSYDDKKTKNTGVDTVLKVHDHCMDGTRYFLHNYYSKPRPDLRNIRTVAAA